jgi:hypothetical protein
VHELIKVVSGPAEELTEIVPGNLHDLGAELTRHAENLAEQKGEPLAPIEAGQHRSNAGKLGFLHQQAVTYRQHGFIGKVFLLASVERPPHVGEGHVLLLTLGLAHVEEVIDRNAIKPRGKLAAPLKAGEMRYGLEEYLLRGVLRNLASPNHPQ